MDWNMIAQQLLGQYYGGLQKEAPLWDKGMMKEGVDPRKVMQYIDYFKGLAQPRAQAEANNQYDTGKLMGGMGY